jgi:hypothetical protein
MDEQERRGFTSAARLRCGDWGGGERCGGKQRAGQDCATVRSRIFRHDFPQSGDQLALTSRDVNFTK